MSETETLQKAVLFYVSEDGKRLPNGHFNDFKIVEHLEFTYKIIQEYVCGPFEMAPYSKGSKQDFVGYINGEGLINDLRRNDLAGGTMYYLGFNVLHLPLGGAYAGNVLLLGKDGRGLTDGDITKIDSAIKKYFSLK